MTLEKPTKDSKGKSNRFICFCESYMKKHKFIVLAVISVVIVLGFMMVFSTPNAETVFKDMNEEMLKTRYVNIDQNLSMKNNEDNSTAKINSNIFMDLSSNKRLLAEGNFSINIIGGTTPMSITGNIIKIGDDGYANFNKISSTDTTINESFTQIESKINNKWIVVRDEDQITPLSKMPIEFMASVLPTPFANLDEKHRKDVLDILRDNHTYTINESSKVEMTDGSTYKYSLSYDKSQYKKVVEIISDEISYFKAEDDSSDESEITSLTVWVNINTKKITKIEFMGTSKQGTISGIITFSKYGQKQNFEKPSNYYIESELLN